MKRLCQYRPTDWGPDRTVLTAFRQESAGDMLRRNSFGAVVASEHVERKLAAILAADVVGYSRLTGADEEGTMRRPRSLRAELIDPVIQANRGRVFTPLETAS